MIPEKRPPGGRPLPARQRIETRLIAKPHVEYSRDSGTSGRQWAIRIAAIFLGVLVVALFLYQSPWGNRRRSVDIAAPGIVKAPLSGAMPWVVENLEIYENAGLLENLDLLKDMDTFKRFAEAPLK
ncbi:MAG: hypothetical protein NTX50_19465 [Candidatus Sumerlaeota bacterium]|nr:hypothetical protein [Candidatus Sumerlaeota bacterium]